MRPIAERSRARGRPTGDSGVKTQRGTTYTRWLRPIALFVLASTHGCIMGGPAANAVGEGLTNAIAALAEAALLSFVL